MDHVDGRESAGEMEDERQLAWKDESWRRTQKILIF